MSPKVSILMPSYNYSNYIATAIDSVINQTYKNWELIIIDDGSTDNSLEIIKSFEDDRIRLFTQKNQGVTQTLNKALRLSKGGYICFLDADDFYDHKKLEKQVNEINMGYDLVTTKVCAVNEKGKNSSDKFFNLWWNTYNPNIIFGPDIEFKFFNGNYLCKSAVMLRKDLFDKYGFFNTKLVTAYDIDLWIKMLPNIKITRCNNTFTYYRWHGQNETITNNERMRAEILLIYDKYLDSLNISLQRSNKQVVNYSLSFAYLFRTQNLEDAYIALQILKKDLGDVKDTFDILYNKEYLNVINMFLDQKDTDYSIIKEGQNPEMDKILKPKIIESIRRKIIPLKVRRFFKDFFNNSPIRE